MSLTPDQKKAVAAWISGGDNLSTVQKRLTQEFKLSMTYRDVRFLVDDLNLELKDPAPAVDASDVTKTLPAKTPAPAASRTPAPDAAPTEESAPAEPAETELDDDLTALPPEGGSLVTIDVDKVTLLPGALASGSVTFSDGVTAKWMVDQYGRPGFTEVSQPGYRPTPEDGQSFMRELSAALQKRGF
ncbi:MAG: hypothetical protein RL077_1107 [Verrucomicrobiota bacterium]|jgi:hypothetical protein